MVSFSEVFLFIFLGYAWVFPVLQYHFKIRPDLWKPWKPSLQRNPLSRKTWQKRHPGGHWHPWGNAIPECNTYSHKSSWEIMNSGIISGIMIILAMTPIPTDEPSLRRKCECQLQSVFRGNLLRCGFRVPWRFKPRNR